MSFEEIYFELARRNHPRASVMSGAPTHGIGTVRSHATGRDFEDDGFSSDDADDVADDTDDEDGHHANSAAPTPPNEQSLGRPLLSSLKPPGTSDGLLHEGIATPVPGSSAQTPIPTPVTARPPLTQSPESSPTTEQAPTLPLPSHGSTSSSGGTPGKPERMKSGLIPKILRRPTLPKALTSANLLIHGRRASSSEAHSPVSEAPTDGAHSEKPVRPEGKRGKSFRKRQPTAIGYNLGGEEDIVGIVMLEIQGATDLPRLTNSSFSPFAHRLHALTCTQVTRTGWDMDPFVIISFGKKVFRTRVIRHSRNPVWEEKLLFHVRRYETRFDVRLTVLDWDKLTSNDHIGDATFSVETLLATAPKMDEQTGLYDISADGEGEMVNFHLPLQTAKEMPWESRHSPMISFRYAS
jgi:phosphatidylserine decarboxylase